MNIFEITFLIIVFMLTGFFMIRALSDGISAGKKGKCGGCYFSEKCSGQGNHSRCVPEEKKIL